MVTTTAVLTNLHKEMYVYLQISCKVFEDYEIIKKMFQDVNGSPGSPNKKIPSKLPMKEKSSNSLKQSLSRSSSKSATVKTPENPLPTEKKSK